MSTILISGCSSGFGLLAALEFARQGDRVYAGVRNADSAGELSGRAAAEQLAVEVVALDVNDPASVHECVSRVTSEAGGLDVLVNNAGIATFAAVEDTDDDEVRHILETNVLGPLRLTRAVLPQMRAQGRGHIVMVSSVNGFIGLPFTGAYSASKFALEALSEALTMELATTGIRVTIIEPGPYHTAIDAKLASTKTSSSFPGMVDLVVAGRNAMASDHPEEVAGAIVTAARSEQGPLRIRVGSIANQLYEARRGMDDEALFSQLMSTPTN